MARKKTIKRELAKKIAERYAFSAYDVDKDVIASEYSMSVYNVTKAIEEAIVYDLIPDEIVEKIKKKSHDNQVRHFHAVYIRNTKSDRYYDGLIEKRLAYKVSKERNEIVSLIGQLEMQLDSFDDYEIGEDEYSRREIEERIEELKKKLEFLDSCYEDQE